VFASPTLLVVGRFCLQILSVSCGCCEDTHYSLRKPQVVVIGNDSFERQMDDAGKLVAFRLADAPALSTTCRRSTLCIAVFPSLVVGCWCCDNVANASQWLAFDFRVSKPLLLQPFSLSLSSLVSYVLSSLLPVSKFMGCECPRIRQWKAFQKETRKPIAE